MTPELAPSATLRRAAERERARLERARRKLTAKRESLHEELARLDAELDKLGDRERLLGELVPDTPTADTASRDETTASGSAGGRVLKGAAIRERAARAYYLAHGPDKALHYRRWFELLIAEGVEIAGKDPIATFLTNLGRSPVVVRGDEPGSYAIDPTAPDRLRGKLAELQAELRDLTDVIARQVTPTDQLRDHRAQLTSQIRQLEGHIAEAQRVLAPPAEDAIDAGEPPVDQTVEARHAA